MSNTSEGTCANCGKGEEASIKLKACAACKLVKYCSRDCQSAHRSQHKKDCKRRAAELHDEKLFKQPPPLEDCPICMIRLPSLVLGSVYMNCCGKFVCRGCVSAVQSRALLAEKPEKEQKCPFCRTPNPDIDEVIKRHMKRVEMNDAMAICDMGCYYSNGLYELPQNYAKALELWHRAGELGFPVAYYNIAHAYKNGRGVKRDEKKVIHYTELAAMGGYTDARQNLGVYEYEAGNTERALNHFMIAVKDGNLSSLENIKRLYSNGDATKDDYAIALRSYQAHLDEIKSDQRDEAAALKDEYKYYESGF